MAVPFSPRQLAAKDQTGWESLQNANICLRKIILSHMSVGDNIIDAAISNDTPFSGAPNDVVTDSTGDQCQ